MLKIYNTNFQSGKVNLSTVNSSKWAQSSCSKVYKNYYRVVFYTQLKVLAQLSKSPSSTNICSNSKSGKSTSSAWSLFQAATSRSFGFHAEFMMASSSKTTGPKFARRSVAICLVPENNRSHGTEEAWDGRTSRAIRARVGYTSAWF